MNTTAFLGADVPISTVPKPAGVLTALASHRQQYLKIQNGCLKRVIVDFETDGTEDWAEQEYAEVRWYRFQPSDEERESVRLWRESGVCSVSWIKFSEEPPDSDSNQRSPATAPSAGETVPPDSAAAELDEDIARWESEGGAVQPDTPSRLSTIGLVLRAAYGIAIGSWRRAFSRDSECRHRPLFASPLRADARRAAHEKKPARRTRRRPAASRRS
jgi:hypothetical protein